MARKQVGHIGVGGVTSEDEARAVARAWCDEWEGSAPTHELAVCVMASWKTIFGSGGALPRYPARYPAREKISSCFVHAHGVLNLLCYEPELGGETRLSTALDQAMCLAGPDCGGVRMDEPWPDRAELAKFRATWPSARVVLPLYPHAREKDLGWTVKSVADYGGVVTDISVDAGGCGTNEHAILAVHQLVGELEKEGHRHRWRIGLSGLPLDVGWPWWSLLRCGFSACAEVALRDGSADGGQLRINKVRAFLGTAIDFAAGPA